jgi:hypothetical protein
LLLEGRKVSLHPFLGFAARFLGGPYRVERLPGCPERIRATFLLGFAVMLSSFHYTARPDPSGSADFHKINSVARKSAVTRSKKMKSSRKGFLLSLPALTLCSCSLLQYKASAPDATRADAPPPLIDLTQYKSPNLRENGQLKNVSMAMAISGGGSRAANLATGVLLEMETIKLRGTTNLLREIDYFSTVSGGGLAAGLYLETAKRYIENTRDSDLRNFNYNEAFVAARPSCKGDGVPLSRHLERGYHGNIFKGLIRPKTWFSALDRGDALEKELDDTILGGECMEQKESVTLGNFFLGSKSSDTPKLPMWVANATVFQNGWTFQFAPDVIEKHRVTSYAHRLELRGVRSAGQSIDGYSLPAAVGLKASASFPLAIPASTLGTSACSPVATDIDNEQCNLQLMDGGLSDNTGVITALHLLANEQSSSVKKKLLIVVDAFPGDLRPHSKNHGSPSMMKVLNRVTELNKDAFRQLLRHQLDGLIKVGGAQIKILYLTIDDSELLREIGTNLNVTKQQQDDLIRCGREFISERKEEIEAWLSESPPPVSGSSQGGDVQLQQSTKSCRYQGA